jgi:hypothetical protein
VKRKRSFRLGGGELEEPSVNEVLLIKPSGGNLDAPPLRFPIEILSRGEHDARQRFLAAVHRLESAVLAELHSDPMTEFRNAGPPRAVPYEWRLVEGIERTRTRRFGDLRKSLLGWAQKWRLTDRWCLDWALETLWFWQQVEEEDRRARDARGEISTSAASAASTPDGWHSWHGGRKPFSAPPLKPPIAVGWNPAEETHLAFVERIRSLWEEYLRRYCDDVEKIAREAGFTERTTEIREPHHFLWLAGFQVRGWSAGAIAEAVGVVTPRGVQKAIADLAKSIGLTRRERSRSKETPDVIRSALPNLDQLA